MKHTVIITGFNCEHFAKACIDSVLNQTVKPYEVMIYNDGSTDKTKQVLEQYKELPNVWIWNNDKNEGALKGRYTFVQMCQGEVVSFLGLDDMLEPNALEILDKTYTEDTLLTYGSWKDMNKGNTVIAEDYYDDVIKDRSYRRAGWRATALNTFRSSLIKKVPKELLMHEGEFLKNCTDLAYSFPCLEQCEKQNISIVRTPIYLYRSSHPNTTLKRLGRANKAEVREILKNIPKCKL